jgi:predicted nucleotidyltransferase
MLTKTIVERFHPKRILVFGSHARGNVRSDSGDLDLFIEMEPPRRPPDRAIEISEVFGLRPWPMDIVVSVHTGGSPPPAPCEGLLSVIENEARCCMST